MFPIFLILSAVTLRCDSFNPIYLNLSYSNYYTFSINNSVEYILEFTAPEVPKSS